MRSIKVVRNAEGDVISVMPPEGEVELDGGLTVEKMKVKEEESPYGDIAKAESFFRKHSRRRATA